MSVATVQNEFLKVMHCDSVGCARARRGEWVRDILYYDNIDRENFIYPHSIFIIMCIVNLNARM